MTVSPLSTNPVTTLLNLLLPQPAVIGNPTNADVTEDVNVSAAGQLTASGTISISDPNLGESYFKTGVTAAAGDLGTLTLAANGTYTYSVSDSAVQYLGAGQTKVDTFTIYSADNTSKLISFTIHGTNDAAVIGNPTVHDVTEDVAVVSGNLIASGTLSISDADQGQSSFQTTVVGATGNLGTLTLAANGSYTYSVADSAVQYLGGNDTKVDSFTVTSFDGTSKVVSFTIHGTNDAAVIGDPTVHDVTEDVGVVSGNLVASGTLSVTDVDQGQSSFQTTVVGAAGNLGTLTLAANGSYSYSVADSAVQYLGGSDSKVDSFTVKSFDGTSKVVSFTIHGTNDAAVIGNATVTDVTENVNVRSDGFIITSGSISISDVDQGQAAFQAASINPANGNLGGLLLNADGTYSYIVYNASIQYLAAGQTKVDTFTVTSVDGTTKQISFTIHGTNEAAVIGDPAVHDVTEDVAVVSGNLVASGILSVTDVDQGQASFQTAVVGAAGNLGTLTLAANGAYSYGVADSAVQYLGGSDTKVDSFTVKSFDGTSKVISFTIHGTNDAAVIGNPTVTDVTEDVGVVSGNLVASGTLSVTDVDQGQSSFQTAVVGAVGNLGTLTLAANGAYSYSVADSAVQYLGGSDTKVDSFTVTSFDGTSKVINFTVHGTNDAAVIGDPVVHDVTKDAAVVAGNLIASGTLSVSDPDQGQSSFQTAVVGAAGNLGTLTLAANGAYSYSVANSAVQYLDAGVSKVDSFTVTSFDGTTKVVNFTIHGVHDNPALVNNTLINAPAGFTFDPANGHYYEFVSTQVDVGTAMGDAAAAGGYLATITSAAEDSFVSALITPGASAWFGATDQGHEGQWQILGGPENGTLFWTGLGSNAGGTLVAGQYASWAPSQPDNYGNGENYAVVGSNGLWNDVSGISAGYLVEIGGRPQDTYGFSEDAVSNFSTSQLLANDANAASLSVIGVSATSADGALVTLSGGTVTYDPTNASQIQALAAGQTLVDSFTYTVSDGHGGISTATASLTDYGVNDPAVIGDPAVHDVTKNASVVNGNLIASGTLSVADPDQGQSSFQTTVVGAAGNLGTLTLAANGAYSYSVANSAVQYLDAGITQVDSFTVESFDGTSKVVNFTIHGVHTPPVLVNETLQNVPAGFTLDPANGHYYEFVPNLVGVGTAMSDAAAAGGYLATITSAAEDSFVASLITPGASAWFGATDQGHEGQWQILGGPEDGTLFWTGLGSNAGGTLVAGEYAHWNTNQPDNYGNGENYAVVDSSGGWNDVGGISAGYVIEIGGRPQDNFGFSEDAISHFSTGQLLANDANAAALTVIGVSATSADGAAVTLSGGIVSYDPTHASQIQTLGAGQTLVDSFSYTVSDGHGGISTATASLTDLGVTDSPFAARAPTTQFASDEEAITSNSHELGITLQAPVETANGQVQITGLVGYGTPSPNGSFTNDPGAALAQSGIASLTLSVDGGAPIDLTSTATYDQTGLHFTATVPVNAADGNASSIKVTATASDPAATTVTASALVADAGIANTYFVNAFSHAPVDVFNFNASSGEVLNINAAIGTTLTAANLSNYVSLSGPSDLDGNGVANDLQVLVDLAGQGHPATAVIDLINPHGVASLHDLFHV